MIRRPPRSTLDRSSAASDVYKRQLQTRPRSRSDRACSHNRIESREGRSLIMAKVPITVNVNGAEYHEEIEPRLLLVHFLRESLRLTGTHIGCDTSHCGACTVIMDGKPIKSCTAFAVQADGRSVMTVEGLEQDGKLHPLQDGFFQEHGLQCGYCTPGM